MAIQSVWGIDIGQCSLKAIKLRLAEGELRLEAFDLIEHPKILSQPEADPEQLSRLALEQFLARNTVTGTPVIIAAPGKSGITRFVKLPPVEARQIPEIVRFEAEQQIPFNINEVIWRWQTFKDQDSPDIEVGIFAMKKPDVSAVLDRFIEVGIPVDAVQMAPLALFNFMQYECELAEDGATLLIDIGADKTDLVVADGPRVWTRTMPRGGNSFTDALVKAFKLSFNKAEKLKRTAATSKYARQIFQAMRPVFAELVQEIQRSIGYYTSLHRESRFKRVLGLGNGFRLPGLQKFLEQNLNLPVVRIDSFTKLTHSPAVNAPAFTENVLSFAVAYGLALQGLGLSRIQTNLLPSEISRAVRWSKKRPWFAAAAAMVLVAMAGWMWRAYADRSALGVQDSRAIQQARADIDQYEGLIRQWGQVSGGTKAVQDKVAQYEQMLSFNDFWERFHLAVSEALRNVAKQGSMRIDNLEKLKEVPRVKRDVIVVSKLYKVDVTTVAGLTENDINAGGGAGGGSGFGGGYAVGAAGAAGAAGGSGAPAQAKPAGRGFILYLAGTTPKRDSEAIMFLTQIKNEFVNVCKNPLFAEYFEVKLGRVQVQTQGGLANPDNRPTGPAVSSGNVDALTGEDAGNDSTFTIGWVVEIKEPKPAAAPAAAAAPSVATGGAQ